MQGRVKHELPELYLKMMIKLLQLNLVNQN